MKKHPMKKHKGGMVKGPVGGPAGVAAMHDGHDSEHAAPRSTKVTRASSAGYKKKS